MVERPLIGQGLFLTNGRAANYQRVHTNQAMDTLTEYACLSILHAFPHLRGKLDHISSQGKEAVFATHDTLLQVVKASTLYYKNKKHIYKNHSILTIIYSDAKSTSATALRADKLNPPYYDYVIGLINYTT